MEICSCPRKNRIGANPLCRRLREVRDNDRVVVGARGLQQQTPEQRMVWICKLQELAGRRKVEDRLKDRLQSDRDDTGNDSARKRVERFRRQHRVVDGCHQPHHDQADNVDQPDQRAADHRAQTLRAPVEKEYREYTADWQHQKHTDHLGLGGCAVTRRQTSEQDAHGHSCRETCSPAKQHRSQHARQHKRGKINLHHFNRHRAERCGD